MKNSFYQPKSGHLKLVCSFNGKLQPCLPSGKLRYVDGETRIVSVDPNIGLSELVSKVLELHRCFPRGNNKDLSSFSLVYRHKENDSMFVPITCNDDVKCMIEEYFRKVEKTLGKEETRVSFFVCYSDDAFKYRDKNVVFNANDNGNGNGTEFNQFNGNQLEGKYKPMRFGYGCNENGDIRSLRIATNRENLFLYYHRNNERALMRNGGHRFSTPMMGSVGERMMLDVSKRGLTVRPKRFSNSSMIPSCSRTKNCETNVSRYDISEENLLSYLNIHTNNISISSYEERSLQRGSLTQAVDDYEYSFNTEKEDTSIKKQTNTNGGIPTDLAELYTYLATKELQSINNLDLEYINEIGSGTYATVFYGKWRGADVAIKKIKLSLLHEDVTDQDRLVADFWKEAYILGQLRHPNIVALYGVVTDGSVSDFAALTEYMVNGSLKQWLRRRDRTIDCRRRLIIAMDAAFGMEYLHEKNIVHFDLKSHNFLVNMKDPLRPVCKIGDLGLAKIKKQTHVPGGVRGTIPWMAPELLNSKEMVDEKVDVYSYGIVMWELLTGEEPYAKLKSQEIIDGIIKDTLRPQVPFWCNPQWKSLMEMCWASDPEARPSFSVISKELRVMAASMNIK